MTQPNNFTIYVAAYCAILLGAVVGCDPDDPCDPDQYADHGLCRYRLPDAAGIDAGADDASDEDSSAMADPNADPFAGFGVACTLQTECEGFGLVCGEGFLPYCTRLNCLGIANACAPDWSCFDTRGSSPDPSVTSVCLKP